MLQMVMCTALWIRIDGDKTPTQAVFPLFVQNRKASWEKHPKVLVSTAQKGLVQQEGNGLGVVGGIALSRDSAGLHLSLVAPQGDGGSGL